jgi:hypothetical protein
MPFCPKAKRSKLKGRRKVKYSFTFEFRVLTFLGKEEGRTFEAIRKGKNC